MKYTATIVYRQATETLVAVTEQQIQQSEAGSSCTAPKLNVHY